MELFEGILLMAFIGSVYPKPGREWTGCYSPQYVEIGETGYVHCQFPSRFNAIYWYENATDGNIVPVLSYSHLVKTGRKYDTGEYDILSNGSLVIKNVSIHHERTFKVMCIDEGDLSRSFVVSVQTTVTSVNNIPTIEGCNPDEQLCLLRGKGAGFLTCRYEGSRPPVQLHWYKKSANQEKKVDSIISVIPENKLTFTTISNISLTSSQNRFLVVLVCEAFNIPLGFTTRKELLVDMTGDSSYHSKMPEVIPFPIRSRATLQCSIRAKGKNYLWKTKLRAKFETIAFSLMGMPTSVVEGFTVTEFGDLIIENVEMRHEGNYTCYYNNDNGKTLTTISLFVVVPPTYPYVSIDGCNTVGNCVINASFQGLLTCRVTDIRPAVSLIWSQMNENENIRLTEGEEVITTKSDLSSVSRTLFYVFLDTSPCGQNIQLQCQADGMGARFLASPFSQVIITKDKSLCHEDVAVSDASKKVAYTVVPVILVILAAFVAVVLYQRRSLKNLCGQRKESPYAEEEQIPLQEEASNKESERKRQTFISHLRDAYNFEKNMNEVYIVNDFSKMDPLKMSSDETRFTLLNSYHELFTGEDISIKKRIIIEGEAGCGKSMFGRYIAEKWSSRDNVSPLGKIPIFILLSLTDFTKETTIYKAIVDQLLPEDCNDFAPKDLETLLSQEREYILFLDGYDEFSERQIEGNDDSVLHKVMSMKLMRNALVYILTRSVSFLRVFGNKKLPIFRLEPFTSEKRDYYLGKKFESEKEVHDVIKTELSSNGYLASLCQIPLFLNMIADMYAEDHPEKLPTRTMTAFFDKLLQCRYRRCLKNSEPDGFNPRKHKEDLKEKMDNEQLHYKPSEVMSKFAFDALANRKWIWETRHLDNLGAANEVSMMINMKILTRDRETPSNKSQTTLVKFSHNIYHYFMAAHYIASIKDDISITDAVKKLDMLASSYVYIFSCGTSNRVLKPIISYILTLDDMYPYPLSDCIIHCLSEVVDYVSSDHQKLGRSFNASFDQQGENQICKDVEPALVPGFSDLLTDFCRRDHGMELRNSDEYYLTSAKSRLLTVCTDKKIRVNVLRLVNVASQIWDGSIHFDVGKEYLTARIPLIHTLIITDYRENLNEHQCLSLIKDIPSLRELCVFSLTTPRLIKEEIITCLREKKKKNIHVFVIWLTFKSLKANDDVFFSYPSTTFSSWMNIIETAIVTIIRKPRDVLKMIEDNKLKNFAAKKFIKNRKIFGDISEEEAVKIMKDKGMKQFFRHTGFPRPLQKILMSELQRFNIVLRDIMEYWQKLDDASTQDEVNFFGKSLATKMKNLPISLRVFVQEEGNLEEGTEESTSTKETDNDETEVWQKGRQNIVSFLKPLYFYFQV